MKARGEKPFFLYVPFTAVHIPIREPEEIVQRVPKEITEPSRRQYAADVMHLDDAVGQLLQALEKTGKAGNTLVFFGSDNGGYPTARNDDPAYPADNYEAGPAGGSNGPLRGRKTEVYEGGIRVPTLVHWPARLKPGSLASPAHIGDWMPTFCALAGYSAEKDLRWDGRDIWPLLTGGEPPAARTIYVAGPGFKTQAIRDGDWKLVVRKPGPRSSSTSPPIRTRPPTLLRPCPKKPRVGKAGGSGESRSRCRCQRRATEKLGRCTSCLSSLPCFAAAASHWPQPCSRAWARGRQVPPEPQCSLHPLR